MYAIIEDSGTQIMVRKGDVIDINPRELGASASSIKFPKVIAVGAGDGTAAKVGSPYLAGASVTADIVKAEQLGEKLRLGKYSRRKGYRRIKGSRQTYIRVRISSID